MEERIVSQHSANYLDDDIKRLTGQERFVNGSEPTAVSIVDFWQWAYSDLIRNTQRGVLAEFIVKLALEAGGIHSNYPIRLSFEPYDLLGPSINPSARSDSLGQFARIEVKSTAYIQAWERRHPDREQVISFNIAPAKVPDETGDYPDGAPRQRNSDLYVFCLFTPPAEDRGANILDLDLWRFWVAKTSIINEICGPSQSVSTKSKRFAAITTNTHPLLFSELCGEVIRACKEL